MRKIKKVPTIIAIIVLVVGTAIGVVLVQSRQIFRLGASPDIAPQDIRVSNITEGSFTLSWTTDKETVGAVLWGENQSTSQVALPPTTDPSTIHWVTVENLTAGKTYYYKIKSDNQEFDNSGIAWNQKTATEQAGGSQVLSGSVVTASGQPASNVVVYISAGGIDPVSALTSSAGNWVIPVPGNNLSQTSPLLEILVQAGANGSASARIFPGAANPTPTITLGQTHDFRNQPVNQDTTLPQASLELPENTEATPSSGFEVGNIATKSSETVTLESVDEGETITTDAPEFFGEGPSGTKITITVESTPQTDTVTVASTGNWNWSPPDNLEPGSHKITISWRDASGILRTLTRTFIVQASEGPSFETTPSAGTASPTPTPTATPKATATPTSTPKATATPSATPATSSAVPVSGVSTPTIGLLLTGTVFIGLGVVFRRWNHNLK